MSNFYYLRDLLRMSEIPAADAENLINLFALAQDEDLSIIVKLVEENPAWIAKINENYKRKKEALSKNDQTIWNDILKSERKELSSL